MVAALGAVAVAACGGGDSEDRASQAAAEPVGEVRAGSVAQLADCADWMRGTRAERLATIDDVRAQINLQDAPVRTPELSDPAAYEVLQNTCSQPFAKRFRLYKIYARAAAFQSFTE